MEIASLAEEINHLAALVDDLQALALADAGALNVVKEPLRLGPLVEQVADAFRHRLEDRGITLEVRVEDGVTATADPQRLRQLLHNLLENCAAVMLVAPEGYEDYFGGAADGLDLKFCGTPEAFAEAIGDKAGVRRFASGRYPLDEALIDVALDLSGRPHVEWHVPMPEVLPLGEPPFDPQLAEHAVTSFAQAAAMTPCLPVKATTPSKVAPAMTASIPATAIDGVQ